MSVSQKKWPSFLSIVGSIFRGKTLVRTLFNEELRQYKVAGRVLDIGGGRNQDYFEYLKKEGVVEILTTDLSHGREGLTRIDFEKDRLPYGEGSIDTVVAFNILEHIFNHKFLVGEIFRVTKKGGTLIGFVPFLVNYHPDPHDYFRYTKEALNRILADAGYSSIRVTETGGGPFAANYNNIVLSVPMIIRVVIFPVYFILDRLFVLIRPRSVERYPLGYLFTAMK